MCRTVSQPNPGLQPSLLRQRPLCFCLSVCVLWCPLPCVQGLRETGVFNDECKWAVLRQQVRRRSDQAVGKCNFNERPIAGGMHS